MVVMLQHYASLAENQNSKQWVHKTSGCLYSMENGITEGKL